MLTVEAAPLSRDSSTLTGTRCGEMEDNTPEIYSRSRGGRRRPETRRETRPMRDWSGLGGAALLMKSMSNYLQTNWGYLPLVLPLKRKEHDLEVKVSR